MVGEKIIEKGKLKTKDKQFVNNRQDQAQNVTGIARDFTSLRKTCHIQMIFQATLKVQLINKETY
ncbi:MAG: hypothetical protein ACFB0E_05585 [Leptolyngbyaceae cyanobacterium]